MPTDYIENAFDTAVTTHLLAAGDPAKFDAKLALDLSTTLAP